MLGGIAYQDFRSRSVYWFFYPMLAGGFIWLRSLGRFSTFEVDLLINLVVIFVRLALLTIVLSLKGRQIIRVWKGVLGWGDILFFVTLAFYLSILNFIVFDISSLLITLLCWKVYKSFHKNVHDRIPLAGIQAVLLILLLIADWCWLHVNIGSDDWTLKYLLLWQHLSY